VKPRRRKRTLGFGLGEGRRAMPLLSL